MKKTYMIILVVNLILLSIVFTSGCTNSYKMFDGTKMSFEYPSDWEVAPGYNENGVIVAGDSGSIDVVVLTNSSYEEVKRNFNSTVIGEKQEINSTNYKYFVITEDQMSRNTYIVNKNDKVYMISGKTNYSSIMEHIIETIQ